MILHQNKETGYWTEGPVQGNYRRAGIHSDNSCLDGGCGIHNHPSVHAPKDAPMNWRFDRGILERICEHNVGHPDFDSARYLESIGKGYENIHACDGCCSDTTKAPISED